MVSPFDLLKQAIKLFFANFLYFLKFMLVRFGLIMITFLLMLIPLMTSGIFSHYSFITNSITPFFPHLGPGTIIAIIVLSLLEIVVSLWLNASQYIQIKAVTENSKISVKDLLKQGWGILGKFFITSIVAGLVVVLGFMLLFIPGIIFAVWFSFALPVLLFEEKSGPDALSRSRELVKGRFWQVAWYMAFPVLIIILVQAVGGTLATTISKQVGGIFNATISILFIPAGTIMTIYSLLIYKVFSSTSKTTPT